MLLIIPVKYRFETTLTPKRVARKLDGELTEFRPSLNIMSVSKFMKNHRFESVYYGRREGEKFQVFYHKMKKRDGAQTGFFGTVEKSTHGSVISGTFRKPVYTYVTAIIWTLLTLFVALVTYSLKINPAAYVSLALAVLGDFLMFWDNKKSMLMQYLNGFPEYETDVGEQE